MEVNGAAESHLQSVENPMLEQVAAPEEDRDTEGRAHWSSLLQKRSTLDGEVHGRLSPLGGIPPCSNEGL